MQPVVATTITVIILGRALLHQSLTPFGVFAALLTAVAHAVHPWPVFYALLIIFFLGGTSVTKVKHAQKSKLTLSASGGSSHASSSAMAAPAKPPPRTHIQVLANSIVASCLTLLHAYGLRTGLIAGHGCWRWRTGEILVAGIISNYAAVAADTFSSELGILAKQQPIYLPSLLLPPFRARRVPPGTNGGVTMTGILAGAAGALTIALTTVILLPFCPATIPPSPRPGEPGFDAMTRMPGYHPLRAGLNGGWGWSWREKGLAILAITIWGTLGSLLDSLLGAWLQASVVDVRSGKVVESDGGEKVQVSTTKTATKAAENSQTAASRRILVGRDILSNNGVNVTMALLMSLGGMLAFNVVFHGLASDRNFWTALWGDHL